MEKDIIRECGDKMLDPFLAKKYGVVDKKSESDTLDPFLAKKYGVVAKDRTKLTRSGYEADTPKPSSFDNSSYKSYKIPVGYPHMSKNQFDIDKLASFIAKQEMQKVNYSAPSPALKPAKTPMDTFKDNKITSAIIQQPLKTMGTMMLVPAAIESMGTKFSQELEEKDLSKQKKLGKITTEEYDRLVKPAPISQFQAEHDKMFPRTLSGQSKLLLSDAQKGRDNATENLSGIGKDIADFGFGAADLATYIAISKLLGIPVSTIYGLIGGAESAQRAIDEGYDSGTALTFGVGTGMLTKAIEGLGGIGGNATAKAILKPLKPLANKIPLPAVNYANSALNSTVGKLAKTALSEGIEEGVEYNAQRILENKVLNKNIPFNPNEMAQRSIYGAMLGGMYGGGKQIADSVQSRAAINSYVKNNGVADMRTLGINPMLPGTRLDTASKPDLLPRLNMRPEPIELPKIDVRLKNQPYNVLNHDNRISNANINVFIDDAVKNVNTLKYLNFKNVSGKEANDIKANAGINVSGYAHSLSDNDIRHILNQHGNQKKESQKGQIAITKEDIKKIPLIIEGYDNVQKGTSGDSGRQSLRYSKTFEDGNTYYVEVVNDKNKTLCTKTMWKKPIANINIDTVDAHKNTSPTITSKTALVNTKGADARVNMPPTINVRNGVNNTTISPDNSVVNNQYMQESGNNAKQPINKELFGKNTVGAAESNPNSYSAMQNKYGTIKPGEKPTRMIDVPKQTNDGTKTRKFVRTAMEAEATPDAMISDFEKEIEKGTFAYESIGDKDAKAFATNLIKNRGYNNALARWNGVVEGDRVAKKEDIVLGEVLYQQAANAGDTKLAMKLVAEIAVEGTRAGQNVQALRMLKKLTPDGQLYYLQRAVNKLNDGLARKMKNKAPNLQIDEQLALKLLNSKTKADVEAASNMIMKNVGEQVPSTWLDKWNAWRYLSMLGNPRTHIRNILGNAVFMPARKVKNIIGTGLERVIPIKEKTKSFTTTKEQRNFAKLDFKEMESVVSGNGKLNPADMIRDNQVVFNTKWLEKLRTINFKALETEDMWTLKSAYTDSMAQFMNANKYTSDFLKSNSAEANTALEKARTYAISEAQKATYRDASAVANALNRFKSTNAVTNIIGEGLFPFTKTPINVLRRGIEYSPVGLAKGLTYDLAKLKQGEINASQVIDDISAGLTGTGILALGAWLASMGIVTGGKKENEKEESFSDLQGNQNYAIQIGDTSYTIDWLAPVALPLFIGVETYNALKSENSNFNLTRLLDNITKISEPMFNLTMLQGINNALNTVAYSQGNAATDILINTVVGYANQGIPTIFGQTARSIDGTRRNTYFHDKNSQLPRLAQTTLQKTAAKLPFASMTLEPFIDQWGNEDKKTNVIGRTVENFFSPGYISKNNPSKLDTEIQRLYRQTGESYVFPSYPAKSFVHNNETYNFTAKEYTEFAKFKGKTAYNTANKMILSPQYNELEDDEKSKVIMDIYDYSTALAKKEICAKYELPGWVNKAKKAEKYGVPVERYIICQNAIADIKANKDWKGDSISGSAKEKKIKAIMSKASLSRSKAEELYGIMYGKIK